MTFDADLSALRDAIHQFGHVTSSQSLTADDGIGTSWLQLPSRCSHNADDQVSLTWEMIEHLFICVVQFQCLNVIIGSCAGYSSHCHLCAYGYLCFN